jgi:glycerophosphoryl diester phosphodiesterase
MGPGISLLREHPRIVDSMAKHGRRMHVWTVNNEADLDLCLELGVRAVITDRPAYILDLLDSQGEVAG